MSVMRTEALKDVPRKSPIVEGALASEIPTRLERYQEALLRAAVERREANSHRGVKDLRELSEIVDGPGGFVYAGWCGSAACEETVKTDTKATIRVIPFEEYRSPAAPSTCLVCGSATSVEVVWARAY
jgi:prolyl-tRNA synthetase